MTLGEVNNTSHTCLHYFTQSSYVYCDQWSLYSLSLETEVAPQQNLVLFVGAELDGGIGHDPHHGGRVPPPQTEQPILHVCTVDEPEGLLDRAKVGSGAYWHFQHVILQTRSGNAEMSRPLRAGSECDLLI